METKIGQKAGMPVTTLEKPDRFKLRKQKIKVCSRRAIHSAIKQTFSFKRALLKHLGQKKSWLNFEFFVALCEQINYLKNIPVDSSLFG